MYFAKHGEDPGQLSVQYLVDCAYPSRGSCEDGVNGCCGGYTPNALNWVAEHGGIPTKAAYGEYVSGDRPSTLTTCKSFALKTVTTSGSRSAGSTESAMSNTLCDNGPIAIGIWASQWQHYLRGVMSAASCGVPAGPARTNHAVQAVGVDNEAGVWIVQNSWGPGWGVSQHKPYNQGGGFILLEYGSNTCNILTHPATSEGMSKVR